MHKDDLVYIGHVVDLADQARDLLRGKTHSDFESDLALRLAITHLLQTIGEAARRLSDGLRTAHPKVPWPQIVGMRHKIVHDYMDIDFDVVWDTATNELPPLAEMLRSLLPDS